MDEFSNEMTKVKLLIFEAIESEANTKNKLERYKKYIKGMNQLFLTLHSDLENTPADDKDINLNVIKQRHLSSLAFAENCIKRSIIQLEDDSSIPRSVRAFSSCSNKLPKSSLPTPLSSMPSKKSIDILLSEKPLNPIDSAKMDLQKTIKNTMRLLQSPNIPTSRKMSVQLQLRRSIAEAMSIASKREAELCKLKTDDLEQLQFQIDFDISRFTVLERDDAFAQLYRSSLFFYQHLLKGSQWFELSQIGRCPEESCLSFILRMNEKHPIILYISTIIEGLISDKDSKEDLSGVGNDIKDFIERIQRLSMVCCLIGNVNLTERNYNAKDALFNLLCNYIFEKKPEFVNFVYNHLFTSGATAMEEYDRNVTLVQEEDCQSLLLPEKLLRFPSVKEIVDSSVLEFSTIRSVYNPLDRMSKLSEIISVMISEITKIPEVEIGADELIPILIYMIIKFNSSEIFLHVKYLELTVPNDYLSSMQGYILVSVSCAIAFCTSDSFKSNLTTSKS